jgi:hypothetical protein
MVQRCLADLMLHTLRQLLGVLHGLPFAPSPAHPYKFSNQTPGKSGDIIVPSVFKLDPKITVSSYYF